MNESIHTFDQLLTALGGELAVREELHVGRTCFANWRARRQIPPHQRERILDLADRRGLRQVTYDVLRRLRFERDDVAAQGEAA